MELVEEMKQKNKDILEELECMVCHKYMYKEIRMCNQGHSLCNDCRNKLSSCPLCKMAFQNGSRNYSLEKIAQKYLKPCPSQGCNEILYFKEVEEHLKICEYNFQCPFVYCGCSSQGGREDLCRHIIRHHNSDLNKFITFPNEEGSSIEVMVICSKNEIFKVYRKEVYDFYELVGQYVGPKQNATNFKIVLKYGKVGNEAIISLPSMPNDEELIFDSTTVIIHKNWDRSENASITIEKGTQIIRQTKPLFCRGAATAGSPRYGPNYYEDRYI